MSVPGFPILLAIIATPAIGAVITLLVPARRPEIVKAVGYAFTTATAGLSAYLLWNFKVGPAGFQFVENRPWIPGLGARFIVGVDGINLFMVVVTGLLFPLGLLASERYIQFRVKAYVAWFLILEMAIMGIFLSLDLIAFFIFWEFMLIPMYFLILGWGSANRRYAATKFFLYTAAGSAFLLASTLVLGFLHQADTGRLTFDFRELAAWNGEGVGGGGAGPGASVGATSTTGAGGDDFTGEASGGGCGCTLAPNDRGIYGLAVAAGFIGVALKRRRPRRRKAR